MQVTFPDVWTNTCCSHPLHGEEQSEVDSPADIVSGSPPGVKHAAVRKLRHELGISAEQLPLDKFRRASICDGAPCTYMVAWPSDFSCTIPCTIISRMVMSNRGRLPLLQHHAIV